MVALLLAGIPNGFTPRYDNALDPRDRFNTGTLKNQFFFGEFTVTRSPPLVFAAGKVRGTGFKDMTMIAGHHDSPIRQVRLGKQGVQVVELIDRPNEAKLVRLGKVIIDGIQHDANHFPISITNRLSHAI
jgi:hypothetical protein